MAFKSSLFTGIGPGFDRLRRCLESPAAHIMEGQVGPGLDAAVRLIQTALTQLGHPLTIDGKFGRRTGDAVFAYKNAKSPKILGPGQTTPDRIVGIGTLTALDLDLVKGRGKGLVDPPNPTAKPIDILVFISGFTQSGGARIQGSRTGGGFLAHDPLRRLPPRSGADLHFIGMEGSLTTLAGVTGLLGEIALKVDSSIVRKIIVYGYSAGGSNAMELSRLLEGLNLGRSLAGLKPIEIDLLVTVDSAERTDSPIKVNRLVAGTVKSVVNFFQTKASPVGGARGGPVSLGTSSLTGRKAFLIERDLTSELGVNLPKFSTHAEIEEKTVDRCVRIVDVELGI